MNSYKTKSQLRAYKPDDDKTVVELKDELASNLYCRVRKGKSQTSKTFIYVYRTDGKVKKITIGKY